MIPYTETITVSSSWSCPESGTYKVICIGQGGDATTDGKIGDMGQIKMKFLTFTKGESVSCTISTYTAFGTHINCAKGASLPIALAPNGSSVINNLAIGGTGGYTLDGTFGGSGAIFAYLGSNSSAISVTAPNKNGGQPGETGLGYGAGGGFRAKSTEKLVTLGSNGAIIIQRVA